MSAQSDQSSLCALWVGKCLTCLYADIEDSDQIGKADLSLHWGHTPFCWFCHDVANFLCVNDHCCLECS